MRRNLAQSLFQHGQVETTLIKAKEVRPFVERLITIARKGTLQSRQRVAALLGDRSILNDDQQEQYEAMTDAQRRKVLQARSGRRHRTGNVPASYNKKTIPFVARSVVHKLMTEIAPVYKDRPGGYTRIIRLSKRRIGDNASLALLQLVEHAESAAPSPGAKKKPGVRRRKVIARIKFLEGQKSKGQRRGKSTAGEDRPEPREPEVFPQSGPEKQAENSESGEPQ